jgi:transcriptional regulator with XRE-family HTH domain
MAEHTLWSEARDRDTLGGRIRRAREAAGLSGAQLARRLGVKTETVTGWETGRTEPRANRLTMLAGFLAVSPTWLLHGVGESPVQGDISSELALIASSLKSLKDHHDRTGEMIERLEAQVAVLRQETGGEVSVA